MEVLHGMTEMWLISWPSLHFCVSKPKLSCCTVASTIYSVPAVNSRLALHWTALGRIKACSCFHQQQPTVIMITARSRHCDSEWACSFARCDDIVRSQSRESRWHCSKCFLWLCNLKRVRRSLDDESMKTLVHAFVTSHVHYGNIILVGAPKSITEKLQRVLNAAGWIVTGTKKYDRGLSHLLHTELHWLDFLEWVLYKLALMVHRCLQDKAP